MKVSVKDCWSIGSIWAVLCNRMLEEMGIDHDGGLLLNTVTCYLSGKCVGLNRHSLQTVEGSWGQHNRNCSETRCYSVIKINILLYLLTVKATWNRGTKVKELLYTWLYVSSYIWYVCLIQWPSTYTGCSPALPHRPQLGRPSEVHSVIP